jgi:hypothetical protein
MKRMLILMLAVMSASAIFGQDKKKVAVYTVEDSKQGVVEFVGAFVTNAIERRGIYTAIGHTALFLKELSKEQEFQHSGTVNDEQISVVAKNMDTHYVCMINVATDGAKKEHFISSRLIDVKTATPPTSSLPVRIDINDRNSIEKACEDIVAYLSGEKGNSRASAKSNKRRNANPPNSGGIEMVFVEATGSPLGISSFYIGKYEVTQAEWQKVMGANPSTFKGANQPVEHVSWHDIQEFLKKLNTLTGGNFRLPAEAEWEYAAKGGLNNDNYDYAGSNLIGAVAWFEENSGGVTHPVGKKQPNSIGIYDMSGNVWEWCQDCFDNSCSGRVIRGGDWYRNAHYCHIAFRYNISPALRENFVGFRLACDSEK